MCLGRNKSVLWLKKDLHAFAKSEPGFPKDKIGSRLGSGRISDIDEGTNSLKSNYKESQISIGSEHERQIAFYKCGLHASKEEIQDYILKI